MTARQITITTIWSVIESDDPDISTEMLMHRTAKTCKCSTEEVCEALEAEKKELEGK